MSLAKATLQQIDSNFENPTSPEYKVTVQFNPETLKVTYANQISTPDAARNQSGTPAHQFVGAGTTKLSLQLWFDVTAEMAPEIQERDVRKLTQKVAYFITPDENHNNVIPAVRFSWGSFLFDGLMESLDESLEFFSEEGIPLRASMTLGLTRQKITKFKFDKEATTPLGTPAAGTRPLKAAPAGKSFQQMAAAQGNKSAQYRLDVMLGNTEFSQLSQ